MQKLSRKSFFNLTQLLQCLVLVSSVIFAQTALAEQFVLFDVTFDYSKADAENSKPSKSHYYVKGKMLNEDRPKNWLTPTDYRNGTVHVRLEVLEKPIEDEPTTWSVCYIPNKGQKNGYGCLGIKAYRKPGVFEQDISMTSFWENDSIVWSEGIKQMDLVIKDKDGVKLHERKDADNFLPTKVRMTLIQVSAGAKYDSKLVEDLFKK